MITQIMAAWRDTDFDFRDHAHPQDPLQHLFEEWVSYYRLKWAIAKVIQPQSILEIGVRYGYSAQAFLDAAPAARFVGIDLDSPEFGGEAGSFKWAQSQLATYDASIVVGDSQAMSVFPGDRYDLVHVDGQQDGDGTYRDLQKALKQASWILVDGYLRTPSNTQASTAFIKDYRELIDFCLVIPGYAGELLIKVNTDRASDLAGSKPDSIAVKSHYGEEYYLTDCGGYREFLESGGHELIDPRLSAVFAIARIGSGMHVVDAGCGRGELTYASAAVGASVDAVDYSQSAIELTKECFADQPEFSASVRFHCADISEFNFTPADGAVSGPDRVIASDLIEHLSPAELDRLYANVAAGLATDGQFVIHTFPNEWYYRYGYEALRKALSRLGGYLSPEPRSFYEQLMHINEQSPRVLRDQLSLHFPHVLVWFGSPENPLDSLMRPYNKIDCMSAPSLYAIASHQTIDTDELRSHWAQQPLTPESMQQVTIELSESRTPTEPRGRAHVTVTVTNGGQEPIKSRGPNPVHISYHWVDGSGTPIVFDGIRTVLPEIGAGTARSISVRTDRPTHDGPLTLQIGMVQEGVAWFESCSDGHLLQLPD